MVAPAKAWSTRAGAESSEAARPRRGRFRRSTGRRLPRSPAARITKTAAMRRSSVVFGVEDGEGREGGSGEEEEEEEEEEEGSVAAAAAACVWAAPRRRRPAMLVVAVLCFGWSRHYFV
jgi:hypothetical protein